MIRIDPDVAKAAEMLERSFEVSKLQGITKSLADLSPALWGRHPQIAVAPAVLISEQTSPKASTQ